MRNASLSLHDVIRIEVGEIRELGTGSFARDIIITDNSGDDFTVTVFSDEGCNLVGLPLIEEVA